MEWEVFIKELWKHHRGKLVGILLGLLFGLLAAIFGFLKTLFIAICIIIGYFIGKRVDENGNFFSLIERFFGD